MKIRIPLVKTDSTWKKKGRGRYPSFCSTYFEDYFDLDGYDTCDLILSSRPHEQAYPVRLYGGIHVEVVWSNGTTVHPQLFRETMRWFDDNYPQLRGTTFYVSVQVAV